MRNQPLFTAVLFAALALSAAACGPIKLTDAERPQTYSLNGVKLIAPEIARGDDPSTFAQDKYVVSGTRRLLLRFEDLNSHVGSILVTGGSKVQVQLATPEAGDAAAAKAALSLCPLTRNWMMLSTWELAHPFGGGNVWSQPGGDYDASGCVKAYQTDQQKLDFDVTQWFIDYPRGRGVNYGFVLLADREITVQGDNSGSYSPRILWSE